MPPGNNNCFAFFLSSIPLCQLTLTTIHRKGGSYKIIALIAFSLVQAFNCVRLFATSWTAECQASLSITNS